MKNGIMGWPHVAYAVPTAVVDAMTTLGQGQRVGIFSGAGIGKSTLLGMLSRFSKAEINVIALIGERGREVRAFIEKRKPEFNKVS
jgi:flagellum-specific ATP synthase